MKPRRSDFAVVMAAAAVLLLIAPVRAAERSAGALDREPCVTIGFSTGIGIDPTGRRERVLAIARLRDGREITEVFPYDWTYSNPAHDNPFFGTNGFRSDLPVKIQKPPRRFDSRTVSPVIAYVLEHTDHDGRFHARACPPLSGVGDRTFPERFSDKFIAVRIGHATDDNLAVEVGLSHKGAGPFTVCAFALNVGTKPVERVRLRWNFKLRSGSATTPQDWRVELPASAGPRKGSREALIMEVSRAPHSCVPVSDDPRLKNKLNDIEQISLTVLGVE